MARRHRRAVILAGMAAGVAWTAVLLWAGAEVPVPIALIQPVLMGALFAPGLVLAAMIGRLAQRRFFDDGAAIDGQGFAPGSGGDVDQRVLANTVEQLVLALCIWPLAGFFLGAGTVLVLGLNFAAARVLFWAGYHLSPPLRALGFAATFYPTLGAALLVIYRLVT